MRLRSVFGFASGLALVFACGSGAQSEDPAAPGATTPSATGADSGAASSDATTAATDGLSDSGLDADPVVGHWEVSGQDARGAYTGEAEIRKDGAGYSFIRTVHYTGITVEDGRELHWLFTGKLTGTKTLTASAQLKRLDFLTKRGALEHTSADGPIALGGTLTLGPDGSLTGTLTAPGNISMTDKWSARSPLAPKPFFVDERTTVPAHAPPTAAEKQQNFATYAQYHQLDVIKPYVNRPEFQAAIHGHVIDMTDLDFYRKNKNALRVVNKVIDDISLLETVLRANSYRYTLLEKAQIFDRDMETRFIDPDVGMVPFGGPPGGGPTDMWITGDSALWTSIYLASQIYRHQVTGEAQAMANIERSLDAMLKLQEITGDWTKFARVLRRPVNDFNPLFHNGTGANSNLQWGEGGNNDMAKGVFYALITSWMYLCKSNPQPAHVGYCNRIRTNAKHFSDDVQVGGSPTAGITNALPAAWLYAVVTDNPGDAITYNAKASGMWSVGKVAVASAPVYYSQGTADWSGTHLTSVGDTYSMLLAQHLNLGGDAESVYRAHIDQSHKALEKQRLPNWHFLKAAFGTGASTTSPFIKEGMGRLIEMTVPKVGYDMDRRVTSDFCMSPYPGAPWKNDYMDYPTEDRTQGLNSYPLFETHPDLMSWMIGNEYKSQAGYEAPGGDYLHVYWFARAHQLLSATD